MARSPKSKITTDTRTAFLMAVDAVRQPQYGCAGSISNWRKRASLCSKITQVIQTDHSLLLLVTGQHVICHGPLFRKSQGQCDAQALLLSGRRRRCVYFYIILKVGKWPGWGLLSYSLVCTEVGMCRQVPLCKSPSLGDQHFIHK